MLSDALRVKLENLTGRELDLLTTLLVRLEKQEPLVRVFLSKLLKF